MDANIDLLLHCPLVVGQAPFNRSVDFIYCGKQCWQWFWAIGGAELLGVLAWWIKMGCWSTLRYQFLFFFAFKWVLFLLFENEWFCLIFCGYLATGCLHGRDHAVRIKVFFLGWCVNFEVSGATLRRCLACQKFFFLFSIDRIV